MSFFWVVKPNEELTWSRSLTEEEEGSVRRLAEMKQEAAAPQQRCRVVNNEKDVSSAEELKKYYKRKLWKQIKIRVLLRDDSICRRRDGRAAYVHHRSYDADVMDGLNDEQRASVCEVAMKSFTFLMMGKSA